MNAAMTPDQIAAMFGCTVEQARKRIEEAAKQNRVDAEKARASKTGKLRGFTASYYEDRAKAFEAVL